jgi:hypothetical protein
VRNPRLEFDRFFGYARLLKRLMPEIDMKKKYIIILAPACLLIAAVALILPLSSVVQSNNSLTRAKRAVVPYYVFLRVKTRLLDGNDERYCSGDFELRTTVRPNLETSTETWSSPCEVTGGAEEPHRALNRTVITRKAKIFAVGSPFNYKTSFGTSSEQFDAGAPSRFLDPATKCRSTFAGTRLSHFVRDEPVKGYETYAVSTETDSMQQTVWYAPELGCAEVKFFRVWLRNDRAVTAQDGDPLIIEAKTNEAMFDVEEYQEITPAEADAKLKQPKSMGNDPTYLQRLHEMEVSYHTHKHLVNRKDPD